LERLGFPWILSSESSIFNGLRWIFAQRNFSRPFAAAPGNGGPRSWHAEEQDHSWGKLNLFSDFLQELVVWAFPFQPPRSKGDSL
jgi:hypothetical protein